MRNGQEPSDNTIYICRGIACHRRGARDLLESLRRELGLHASAEISEAGKLSIMTPRGKFTVRTVACLGRCALAPVAEVNDHICGQMNEHTLHREISGASVRITVRV